MSDDVKGQIKWEVCHERSNDEMGYSVRHHDFVLVDLIVPFVCI